MRNDAVQRMARGQHLFLRLGGDHGTDHCVHGRALYAGEIARVFLVCRRAAEQVGKLLPRVVGALVGNGGDVEVELLQALLVQREVHRAELERDAELLQVTHPRGQRAHAAFAAVHVFQHHGLAAGVAQHAILHLPACLLEQRLCAAQVVAQRGGAVGGGWLEHGAEDRGGQILAPGLQQRQLLRRGHAVGLAHGVAENAAHALIGTIEKLAAHPLKVERQPQGLSHAAVLQ